MVDCDGQCSLFITVQMQADEVMRSCLAAWGCEVEKLAGDLPEDSPDWRRRIIAPKITQAWQFVTLWRRSYKKNSGNCHLSDKSGCLSENLPRCPHLAAKHGNMMGEALTMLCSNGTLI